MRDNAWKLDLAAVTLEEALLELSQAPVRS
jgi:hypothetical protein